ncbi:hypothetical protein GCM10011289_33690 [Paludibacterium paludis]|uniref:Uncharacterized protein n=1 Tax=Paludibacterium paludis TaxID=1225769 RepID=A0A918P6X2_9NEIS|nr:hypothetical protein GCM10011289_33690 [Paludibacterium paludis]
MMKSLLNGILLALVAAAYGLWFGVRVAAYPFSLLRRRLGRA